MKAVIGKNLEITAKQNSRSILDVITSSFKIDTQLVSLGGNS
jgi:hypothetical protein